MADRYELASAIFGTKRAETDASSLSSAIITGTAVEDSEEGVVKIVPDGNVIAPDGEDNTIILPTSPNVKEGDNVIIISTGGTATTPIVTGASGSGDRIVSELNTLLTDVEGIETLIRETTDGVLVAKVGQTVGALVNADGSFDVVEITGWNDGVPTLGDTTATFSSGGIEFLFAASGGNTKVIGINDGGLYGQTGRFGTAYNAFNLDPVSAYGGATPEISFGTGRKIDQLGAIPYHGGNQPAATGDKFTYTSGSDTALEVHPNGIAAGVVNGNDFYVMNKLSVYNPDEFTRLQVSSPTLTIERTGDLTTDGDVVANSFTGSVDWSNIVIGITEQPQDTNASAGMYASFHVGTNDAGATYQWQWYVNGGWARCPHQGNDTHTLYVMCSTVELAAQYRCVVTFSDGTTETSDAASIDSTAAFSIVKQPESMFVSSTSDQFSFTVEVDDSAAAYRWQTCADGTTWTNSGLLNNATKTLGPVNATAARQTYLYRCSIQFSDRTSGDYVYSDVVTVTQNADAQAQIQPVQSENESI